MTPKQEHFARLYVETGNASEAYRQAYNAENMKPETVTNEAYKLLLDRPARQRGITRFNRQWNQRFVKMPSEKYLQIGIEKLDCSFSHKKHKSESAG